jgi:hypothetical protein
MVLANDLKIASFRSIMPGRVIIASLRMTGRVNAYKSLKH